ncbi:MAG: DUF86 domain-containing protein [Armatimonadota bacterium]
MRHDVSITIGQMLTYAREAIGIAGRIGRADLGSEIVLTRSLVHTLEMIGEAARRVPEECRARYPAVPWQDIVDLRNRLIHGYDQVDYDTVWQIVLDDLPRLAAELDRIAQALRD